MAGYCRNCRDPLTALSRSPRSSGFCRNCGDEVWAILPNGDTGEWFLVADPGALDGQTVLAMLDGMRVQAGQCGRCFLGEFAIRRNGKAWDGVCEGQRWDGKDIPGCGDIKPVRLMRRCSVIGSSVFDPGATVGS